MANGPISKHQLMFAVGGLQLEHNLTYSWEVKPPLEMVAADIEKLGLDIKSFKEPLTRAVKKVMIPSIRKNFERGGRPDPWQELAPDTIKLRGYSAWPILVRTGALKKGATKFDIWSITTTDATVKGLPSNIWYGAIHQRGVGGFGQYVEGAKKKLGKSARPADVLKLAFDIMDKVRGGPGGHRSANIPARPFLLYQEDDLDDIQEIFLEWLTERAVAVGRFSR